MPIQALWSEADGTIKKKLYNMSLPRCSFLVQRIYNGCPGLSWIRTNSVFTFTLQLNLFQVTAVNSMFLQSLLLQVPTLDVHSFYWGLACRNTLSYTCSYGGQGHCWNLCATMRCLKWKGHKFSKNVALAGKTDSSWHAKLPNKKVHSMYVMITIKLRDYRAWASSSMANI